MTEHLAIGFLPLVDCGVLVAARECGFAHAEGLELALVRDTSWASARDRLIYRQVHAAHMLAPLAVAVSLGLGSHATALSAPFKLNLNGSLIVLSHALAAALGVAPEVRAADPAIAAAAMARVARARHGAPPVLGIVHRFSSHALILRYWLGSAGLDPDRDVQLRVVPPPFMVEALAAGEIDGFCAGEPWGGLAVDSGVAEIGAVGTRIWQGGVEKVLALRTDWMEANPATTDRLLRALDQAACWCDAPANHAELAALLARPGYLDQPAGLIRRTLDGRLRLSAETTMVEVPDFLSFHRGAAGFPWRSQALWIYAQLVRWGLAVPSARAESVAAGVFRPDVYRRALAGGATPMPGASAKLEGSLDRPTPAGSNLGTLVLPPDRFFDGVVFDPDDLDGYLSLFRS